MKNLKKSTKIRSLLVINTAAFCIFQEKQKEAERSKKSKQTENNEKNRFAKKACDVAASILNMSSADLEELMATTDDNNEDAPTQQQQQQHKYKSRDIKDKLQLILGKSDHFEGVLTHFMLDLVEYYCSLQVHGQQVVDPGGGAGKRTSS